MKLKMKRGFVPIFYLENDTTTLEHTSEKTSLVCEDSQPTKVAPVIESLDKATNTDEIHTIPSISDTVPTTFGTSQKLDNPLDSLFAEDSAQISFIDEITSFVKQDVAFMSSFNKNGDKNEFGGMNDLEWKAKSNLLHEMEED